MTLLIPAKVLLHVWSYDFYDMTLSTGKQRRHMINKINHISINMPCLCRVRSAHLSPGLPMGFTRVNPGWALSLIL